MKVYPDPSSAASPISTAKNEDQFSASVSSPCENIWSKFDDFLLTPPQSPPVEIENMFPNNTSTDDLLNLALDDFFGETNCLSDSSLVQVIDSFENDVLNDCMWSGPSLEEFAQISDPSACARSRKNDTQLFGTSPLGMSFGEMLTCDDVEIDDDDSNDVPAVQDDASSSSCVESTSSGFVSGSESLVDHSYGSPKSMLKSSHTPSTSALSKFSWSQV